MQIGHFVDPDLPDVPMVGDLVSAEIKPIADFFAATGLIGRGLAVPEGTPMDKVKILRAAFDNMVVDPVFSGCLASKIDRILLAKHRF